MIEEDKSATAEYMKQRHWDKTERMEKLSAEMKVKSSVGDELTVSETTVSGSPKQIDTILQCVLKS